MRYWNHLLKVQKKWQLKLPNETTMWWNYDVCLTVPSLRNKETFWSVGSRMFTELMCLNVLSNHFATENVLCTIVKFTVHRPMFSVQFAICISIIKCLKCAVNSLSSIVEDLRKSEHWTSCDNPPLPNPLVNWLTFNDQSSCRRFLANWQNKRKTINWSTWPVTSDQFMIFLLFCQFAKKRRQQLEIVLSNHRAVNYELPMLVSVAKQLIWWPMCVKC